MNCAEAVNLSPSSLNKIVKDQILMQVGTKGFQQLFCYFVVHSDPSCPLKALSPKRMEGREPEFFSTTEDGANKKKCSVRLSEQCSSARNTGDAAFLPAGWGMGERKKSRGR